MEVREERPAFCRMKLYLSHSHTVNLTAVNAASVRYSIGCPQIQVCGSQALKYCGNSKEIDEPLNNNHVTATTTTTTTTSTTTATVTTTSTTTTDADAATQPPLPQSPPPPPPSTYPTYTGVLISP
jgi:thiol:disulfide interchange protein